MKPKRSAVSTMSSLPITEPPVGEVGVARLGEGFDVARVLAVGVADEAAADVDAVDDFDFVVERGLLVQAAVVVIVLKVDPGGCRGREGLPARARTSPLQASSTATPPARPGERNRRRLPGQNRSSSSPAPATQAWEVQQAGAVFNR